MVFDLTVHKQLKGGNGDPGPLTANHYVIVGGGDTGGYYLRGGQVYDSTGVLIEGPMPEAVYKALEQMSNEGRLAIGFETVPERPKPEPGPGVDFTAGPGATPMQLNTPKPGQPDTGKAEPVPQGTEVPVPVRGQRNFVDTASTRQQSAQVQEEQRLQALRDAEHDPVNHAHRDKIEAARRSGAKIDPSLLKK